MRLFDPAKLTMGIFGVCEPLRHRFEQFGDAPPVGDFGQEAIMAIEQPVDIFITATASINADDGAPSETGVQVQHLLLPHLQPFPLLHCFLLR